MYLEEVNLSHLERRSLLPQKIPCYRAECSIAPVPSKKLSKVSFNSASSHRSLRDQALARPGPSRLRVRRTNGLPFGPRTGLSSGEVTALILGCDAGRRGEHDEYCEPIDADGETYPVGSDEDGVRRRHVLLADVGVWGGGGRRKRVEKARGRWALVMESIESSANRRVRQVSLSLGGGLDHNQSHSAPL